MCSAGSVTESAENKEQRKNELIVQIMMAISKR